MSLAGVALFEADDLDWMAGMADENVEEFTTVLKGEEILRPYLTAYAEHFRKSLLGDIITDLVELAERVCQ